MEICTVGSVRGESLGFAMVDLNGHEAGNGGYSQGTPTAHRPLFYSERCPVSRLLRHLRCFCLLYPLLCVFPQRKPTYANPLKITTVAIRDRHKNSVLAVPRS